MLSQEELKALLGRGRAKKGMFEGDLEEGELEIGQIASFIGFGYLVVLLTIGNKCF